jgi:DNA-binding XRE family transcriptional regulator
MSNGAPTRTPRKKAGVRTQGSRAVAPPKSDGATVGSRVRKLREDLGLKQKDLADAVGVAPHTLWRIEAGQHANPRARVLQGLARELRVSVDFLLGTSTPIRAAG